MADSYDLDFPLATRVRATAKAAELGAPAELDPELLARLDNYSDPEPAPTTVAAGLERLRGAGWIGRVADPEFSAGGHASEGAGKSAFSRQLDLLYDVGRGSLPLGRVFEGHVNALELVARFADDVQLARWRADARGGRVFGVWNTEAADGVHVRPHPEGGYVLEGAKTFCSGATDVTRPVITGQRWDGERVVGWQMLVVPMERVGAERVEGDFWEPLGMVASDSLRVDFTGLRITRADLLGEPDDYHAQPHFSGGAVRFAAVQLGGAHALFDHVVAMLRGMHREHDPYQAHRLGRMAIAVQSGRNWLCGAPDRALPGWHPEEDVVHYANMMRTAALDLCDVVLAEAEQAVGARGFLRPRPIQRIYTDLKMYLRQPAPDSALAAVGRRAAETMWSPLS